MSKIVVTGGSGFVGGALITALAGQGHVVTGLARSEAAAARIASLGAEPVRAGLDDPARLKIAFAGADVVHHCAADLSQWGDIRAVAKVNVEGTRAVIEAARAVGVRRVVHVSTEAVLIGGRPLVQADETWPLPRRPLGLYPTTKGAAETIARALNGQGIEVVVVRPRLIWGKGDTHVLPALAAAARGGALPLIGGGRHLTSTCHVRNVVEGMILAAERGQPGEVYFLTDGAPVEMRAFITQLLATQGISPRTLDIPLWLAKAAAAGLESAWTLLMLKDAPALTRTLVCLMGQEMTVDDAKARRDLGYRGAYPRAAGLAELRA